MSDTQELIFKFNGIYKQVFTSKCRYIDIWGGRGRGGSYFVTDYFLHKLTQPDYFRGYLMRSVLNDVRESLWRDLKDRIEEKEEVLDITLFHFDENKMTVRYIPTGNIIISKGFKKSSGSQTAKLKSIAGATHVAIEECEEISEDEFTTLNVSLRTVKSNPQIFRIFNPPDKNHWIIKNDYNLIPHWKHEDYFIARPKENDQLLSIFSTYHDNIENLNETFVNELEKFKYTNPEYYKSNVLGLVSSGKKGRIFPVYDFYEEIPDERLYRVYGLDFGYSPDPSVLVEVNVNRENKRIYVKELHRGKEMTTEQIYTVIAHHNNDRHEVICDNAEPRERHALQAYGLNIMKAQKGAGSRRAGRDLMNMFSIFVHKSSVYYHEELENHTWALDANKMPTGKPIDGWDHGIDATVYALNYYVKTYGF